jgi:hypothetical protein
MVESTRKKDGGGFEVVLSSNGADWWRSIGWQTKSPGLGNWVRHGQADDARQPAGQTLLHNNIPSKTTRLSPPTATVYCHSPRAARRAILVFAVPYRSLPLPRHHTSRHVPHLSARPSPFAIARVCNSTTRRFHIYKHHHS